MKDDVPNLKDFDERLREEAHQDLADVLPAGEMKKTQIIAIYGKGGIGKSFTLANLSHVMAEQGKRVLLIGCDPKSDTTSLLFGGKACPTIIETSTRKKLAGEEVKIGDVCFKRGGVYAMELGGPEVGRGCGGRGMGRHGRASAQRPMACPRPSARCAPTSSSTLPSCRSGRTSSSPIRPQTCRTPPAISPC